MSDETGARYQGGRWSVAELDRADLEEDERADRSLCSCHTGTLPSIESCAIDSSNTCMTGGSKRETDPGGNAQ